MKCITQLLVCPLLVASSWRTTWPIRRLRDVKSRPRVGLIDVADGGEAAKREQLVEVAAS